MNAYCPPCGSRQPVLDNDQAHTYRPWGEVTMPVAILECGHTVSQGPETVAGAAPGAPYAGPERATVLAAQTDPYAGLV